MKRKKVDMPDCKTCITRKDSIFCNLSSHEIKRISEVKGCNLYERGQMLFYEEANVTGIHCIHSGKIKIGKTGLDGKEQIVKIVNKGDVLGYNSLLCGQPYNVSAEALETTVACFIPKDMFFSIIETNTEFPRKLMEMMSADMQEMQRKLTNWLQKSVLERLAETLLLLHRKYPSERSETLIDVRLTREDIANIIGTAPESVIRYLSDLKNDGTLNLRGKEIHILKPDRLIRIANLEALV
ncbi:MAG: Crp/Fnr family transcriptional regulator [Bernardetiaceae bacterium]|nr:Crp/Fnr family transcriptional regulator [Bernardetiaceae bacterium]